MSRVAKLGIVAGVLLVVAIVVHWALGFTPRDILRGYERQVFVSAPVDMPGYSVEDFFAAIEQELVAAGLDPDNLPEPEPVEGVEVTEEEVSAPAFGPEAKLPEPRGPEDAPVKITVFAEGPLGCPEPLMRMIDRTYEEYPGVLCIVYKNMRDEEIRKLAEEHKLACLMGILINGKSKFTIPGRKSKYGEVVMFDGPPRAAIPAAETSD